QRGDKAAGCAPQRKSDEKRGPVLREAGRQDDDCDCAHKGTDQTVPALAQRRTKMRLTDDRRRGAGPIGVVKLEPKRDVKSETDRGPQPQPEQQRRARRPRPGRPLPPPSRRPPAVPPPPPPGPSVPPSPARPRSPA